MERKYPLSLQRISLLALALLLWEFLAGGIYPYEAVVDPFYISSPTRIGHELYELFASGEIMDDIALTLGEAFSGLILGVISGVVIGLIFAYSETISSLLEPLMAALNSLPRVALAPLVILWFGIGVFSKVFLSWSLVFFIIFYNTFSGVRSIDPDIINAIRIMGASRYQLMRIVVLPSVFSWIFAALRVSISYALIGAIVGEFVGAVAGIGYQIIYAEGLLLVDRLYSLLIILAVIGIALNEVAKRVEEKALRWRPAVRL
ncbi:TPA: ABC transporter permease [Candidatus Bathyarchaeota archaeon]|nr:ABC transporter permease [Candidatus Bathyarchaeota archaeon]